MPSFVENINKLANGLSGSLVDELSYIQTEISTLQNDKVDKVAGKQLSTEDYTTTEKTKLASLGIHPAKHPVSILDGNGNFSKFVKTDALGNTGFGGVTWAEVEGKPNTYTPSSHEHSLEEVTSGSLAASRVMVSETRQFITAEQATQLLEMEVKSNKGIPNGYAPLDSNGKINSSFLNDLNLVEVFTPADLASMLALTSAQPGDIAYRQDNSTSYMLVALPSSTEANWKSLNTGSQVISVNDQTGIVSLNTSNIAESTNLYFTNERVDDRVANLLQAGTNISLAYDDASNTLTINANDTSVNWSEIQSKPVTLSGYGITDVYTKTESDAALLLKAADITVVHKTGDEAIAGVKTFNNNIVMGTDSKIQGDFSNSTAAHRTLFQTSTLNAATSISAIPNGTGVSSLFVAYNKSDTTNASYGYIGCSSSYFDIVSSKEGTGAYLPMAFYTGGAERMRIDTSGNVGIGTSSPVTKLDIRATAGGTAAVIAGANAGGNAEIRVNSGYSSTIPVYAFYYNSNSGLGNPAQDNVSLITGAVERMRIDSSGNVLVTGSGGLGYGTGAGGTVTQVTSKSTTVTLNKPSGQITMNNAALAAGASVKFALTTSSSSASDLCIANIVGGVSGYENYNILASPYAGGITFTVKNISTGSLSEAIVINFAIIKGANA